VDEWERRVEKGVNKAELGQLKAVKGNLIKFSTHFLVHEDLTPSLMKNPFYAALDHSPMTAISMAMFY